MLTRAPLSVSRACASRAPEVNGYGSLEPVYVGGAAAQREHSHSEEGNLVRCSSDRCAPYTPLGHTIFAAGESVRGQYPLN